jgi:hypothetical protein
LKFQLEYLENFQRQKDEDDTGQDGPVFAGRSDIQTEHQNDMEDMAFGTNEGTPMDTQEDEEEELMTEELNDMYSQRWRAQNRWCEEDLDDEQGGHEDADEENVLDDKWEGFEEYLPPAARPAAAEEIPAMPEIPATAEMMDAANMQLRDIPRTDALNNQYVRVVHVNGIHHLALVTCECHGQGILPLDLMACRLVPTTFNRVRTLFTTLVLDHFRLSNLEIKASAYQYFQLLRRMTRPTAPTQVPNLYHELRRLSRAWRWMKKQKWAGLGSDHSDPVLPKPGELGNFCAACPQSGINMPSDWKDDPNQ